MVDVVLVRCKGIASLTDTGIEHTHDIEQGNQQCGDGHHIQVHRKLVPKLCLLPEMQD